MAHGYDIPRQLPRPQEKAPTSEVSMKNSLPSARTGNAVLRLMLPAILAGGIAIGCGPQGTQVPQGPQGSQGPQGPQATPSAQYSLVGQWRGVIQGSTVIISIQANGQYMQVSQGSGGTTGQSGPYQLIAPNTIHFTVTDWSPKTVMIYVPNPTCGVPAVPNPTNPGRDSCLQEQEETYPQPPGSSNAYAFNGPNTMTLTDEVYHGSATFTRVTGQ
jgi:hypothetical protein